MKTTEDSNKNELMPEEMNDIEESAESHADAREETDGIENPAKKKNEKVMILSCVGVFIVLILGVLAFINFKTTLFVTYQVCSAEGVNSGDYMVFRMLESGETRAVYQEKLETQIRCDKALAEWESDCALIPEVVSANISIQNDLMKIWSFVGADDATYEELKAKLDGMSFGAGLEGVNIGELARYTAQFMASDSYYVLDSIDKINGIKASFRNQMKPDTAKTTVRMRKINMTEYDPAEADSSAAVPDATMQMCRNQLGDDTGYKYIAEQTSAFFGYSVVITVAVNEESCKVLGARTSVPGYLENYIAHFELCADGTYTDNTAYIVQPVVVDLAAARETADKFAALLSPMFKPLIDDEALAELYYFFYGDEAVGEEENAEDEGAAEDEEDGGDTEGAEDAENAEGTDNAENADNADGTDLPDTDGASGEANPDEESQEESDNGEGGGMDGSEEGGEDTDNGPAEEQTGEGLYENLKFVSAMKSFSGQLENDFNVSEEWGILNILLSIQQCVEMCGSSYVDYRYLQQNFDELFAEANADDAAKVREELETNIAQIETLRGIIRLAGDVSHISSEIHGYSAEELLDIASNYDNELQKWYPENKIGQIFYVTDVKYGIPCSDGTELLNVIFGVATTEVGNRIVTVNIDFNENMEGLFADYADNNIASQVNVIFMLGNARAAVNREEYSTQAEYELALQRWLYLNYPDYWDNPDAGSAPAQTYTASGYSNGTSLWGTIKNGLGTIYEWATTDSGIVWTSNGWTSSLSGIWRDMENGYYGSIPQIAVNGTEAIVDGAKNIYEGVKEGVSDAWNGIKDWWGGLW